MDLIKRFMLKNLSDMLRLDLLQISLVANEQGTEENFIA
jgi:hypothetical protein